MISSAGDCGEWQATARADGPSCHVSERTIAITGGDAGYFDLMKDCVGSLRATAEGRALALGILDCGLTEEQRAWCRGAGRDAASCRSGTSTFPVATS